MKTDVLGLVVEFIYVYLCYWKVFADTGVGMARILDDGDSHVELRLPPPPPSTTPPNYSRPWDASAMAPQGGATAISPASWLKPPINFRHTYIYIYIDRFYIIYNYIYICPSIHLSRYICFFFTISPSWIILDTRILCIYIYIYTSDTSTINPSHWSYKPKEQNDLGHHLAPCTKPWVSMGCGCVRGPADLAVPSPRPQGSPRRPLSGLGTLSADEPNSTTSWWMCR